MKTLTLSDVLKFELTVLAEPEKAELKLNLPCAGILVQHLSIDPREAGEYLNMIYALHPLLEFYYFNN